MLGDEEYLLLFQRACVWFQAPHGGSQNPELQTASSQGPDALFCPLWVPSTYVVHVPIYGETFVRVKCVNKFKEGKEKSTSSKQVECGCSSALGRQWREDHLISGTGDQPGQQTYTKPMQILFPKLRASDTVSLAGDRSFD